MLHRDNSPLAIYLNDHLAGSSGAIELGERLVDDTAGTDIGPALAALVDAIKEDRGVLENLMDRLEIAKDPVKQGLGWIGEKVSRLKLAIGSGPAELGRLLSLEALSAGVQAKASLWRCLRQLGPEYPALATTDFDELLRRAETQLTTLDELRTTLVPAALLGSPT